MVEKHCRHLSPSYVAETVRGTFGLVEPYTVVAGATSRQIDHFQTNAAPGPGNNSH